MKLILARHAVAEEDNKKADAERSLSEKGREQAAQMGKVIAAALRVPDAVWSSPLLRSVETARVAMAAMGASGAPESIPDLAPGGDPDRLAVLVQRSGVDLLMLVGHQPDLGTFAGSLLGVRGRVEIRKGGLVVLETSDPLKPQGRAIATLTADDYPLILEGKQYAPWMGRLRV